MKPTCSFRGDGELELVSCYRLAKKAVANCNFSCWYSILAHLHTNEIK